MKLRKILIVGRGGREHALASKFKQSVIETEVFVAPGAFGIENSIAIDENDFDGLISFAKKESIDLTVVGPEVPLVNGIVDRFQQENLAIWGPCANAAVIEGSKAFAKDMMKKYGIPTAAYEVFSDYDTACRYLDTVKVPIVVKADGLAAGKGVVIAQSKKEACEALEEILVQGKFDELGKGSNNNRQVVIEEYMVGEEFSFIALVAGERVIPMALAQDHKRAFDNDEGPNTGGMGAYSPVPQISEDIVKRAVDEILLPTAQAMVQEKRPFYGFLFAGLIATDQGPKVIEFNARLGDPEAEVLLPRLENDLFEVIIGLLDERVPQVELKWSPNSVVGVVLASKGYPGVYEVGFPISGLDDLEKDTFIFHCGVGENNLTAGGRVLLVARMEKDLASAQEAVYKEISKIKCNNLFYRKDIGNKAKWCG